MTEHKERLIDEGKRYVYQWWHRLRKKGFQKLRVDSTGHPTDKCVNFKNMEVNAIILQDMLTNLMKIEREIWNQKSVLGDPTYGYKHDSFELRAGDITGKYENWGPYKIAEFTLLERGPYKYSTLAEKFWSSKSLQKIKEAELTEMHGGKEIEFEPDFFPGLRFEDGKIRILPTGTADKIFDMWQSGINTSIDNKESEGLLNREYFEQDLLERLAKTITMEEFEKNEMRLTLLDKKEGQTILNKNKEKIKNKILERSLTKEEFLKAFNEVVIVKLPPEYPITYPDGYTQTMRLYGFEFSTDYKQLYREVLEKMCFLYLHYIINVKRRKYFLELETRSMLQSRIDNFIKNIKTMFEVPLSSIIDKVLVPTVAANESKMRKYVNDAMSYFAAKPYETDLNYLKGRNPIKDNYFKHHVHCKHTYRVIVKPYYRGEGPKGKIVGYYRKPSPSELNIYPSSFLSDEAEKSNFRIKPWYLQIDDLKQHDSSKYEEYIEQTKDFIPVVKQWDYEYMDGMDEFGMPLEIEDINIDEPWPIGGASLLADQYKIDYYENTKARGDSYLEKAKRLAKTTPPSTAEHHKEVHNYRGRKVRFIGNREIYLMCTDYVDLCDMASYLENEWDAIRDDLRDGRYHKNSLTVYDYITAFESMSMYGSQSQYLNELKDVIGESKPLIELNQEVMKKLKKGESVVASYKKLMSGKFDQEYADKVRTYVMNFFDKDKNEYYPAYLGMRKATNLTPAFDMRAIKHKTYINWQHPGRIFYYQTVHAIDSDILPKKYDPHVTTRGLSMFMVDYVNNNEKYLVDIVRILKLLAEKADGFDYGPRHYGQMPTKDPSNIDLSRMQFSEVGPK